MSLGLTLTARPGVETLKHLINFPPAGHCIFIKGSRQDAAEARRHFIPQPRRCSSRLSQGAAQINARMSPGRLVRSQQHWAAPEN